MNLRYDSPFLEPEPAIQPTTKYILIGLLLGVLIWLALYLIPTKQNVEVTHVDGSIDRYVVSDNGNPILRYHYKNGAVDTYVYRDGDWQALDSQFHSSGLHIIAPAPRSNGDEIYIRRTR